jgi:hypothetical protein
MVPEQRIELRPPHSRYHKARPVGSPAGAKRVPVPDALLLHRAEAISLPESAGQEAGRAGGPRPDASSQRSPMSGANARICALSRGTNFRFPACPIRGAPCAWCRRCQVVAQRTSPLFGYSLSNGLEAALERGIGHRKNCRRGG